MQTFEDLISQLYIAGKEKDLKKSLIHNKKIDGFLKFRNTYTDNIDDLKQGRIWASRPNTFNDPFDCAFNYGESIIADMIDGDSRTSDIQKINMKTSVFAEEAKKIQEVDDEVNKSFKEFKENIFVICLTLKSSIDNILMWSHYTENHKGFCVEMCIRDRTYTH